MVHPEAEAETEVVAVAIAAGLPHEEGIAAGPHFVADPHIVAAAAIVAALLIVADPPRAVGAVGTGPMPHSSSTPANLCRSIPT